MCPNAYTYFDRLQVVKILQKSFVLTFLHKKERPKNQRERERQERRQKGKITEKEKIIRGKRQSPKGQFFN